MRRQATAWMHAAMVRWDQLRSRWSAALPAIPPRWDRPLRYGLTAVLLIIAVVKFAIWLGIQSPVDRVLYRTAALRWEAGLGYFYPFQLAGPHQLGGPDILYPPVALWLLVPFAHLPEILWVVVPASILAGTVIWLRPGGWALPFIALCMVMPTVQSVFLTERPTMWIAAFFGLGLVRGGWGALVLLKPSLFPLALVGVHRRSWWLTLGLLVVLSVPFGSLWLDWLTAVRNSGGGLLYSLPDLPLFAIPAAAWLGRHRPQPAGRDAPNRALRGQAFETAGPR